jgi:hypothetical protein
LTDSIDAVGGTISIDATDDDPSAGPLSLLIGAPPPPSFDAATPESPGADLAPLSPLPQAAATAAARTNPSVA